MLPTGFIAPIYAVKVMSVCVFLPLLSIGFSPYENGVGLAGMSVGGLDISLLF